MRKPDDGGDIQWLVDGACAHEKKNTNIKAQTTTRKKRKLDTKQQNTKQFANRAGADWRYRRPTRSPPSLTTHDVRCRWRSAYATMSIWHSTPTRRAFIRVVTFDIENDCQQTTGRQNLRSEDVPTTTLRSTMQRIAASSSLIALTSSTPFGAYFADNGYPSVVKIKNKNNTQIVYERCDTGRVERERVELHRRRCRQ